MKTRSNRLNNGYVGGNFLDNSQYGILPVNKQATFNEWTRPTDWLSLPSMVEGDSKIAGLVAVYPGDTGSTGITASSNFVAFTVFGNYTVDWGDGTTAAYSSGETASKQYLWEGASADTLTFYGFRQRVFQITPQAGAGLTSANFVAYYPGVTLQTAYSSAILDLKISGASLSIINPPKGMFRFEYIGNSSITTVNIMFNGCRNLCNVIGTSWTKNCNTFTGMFIACPSLQTVPLFNTALGNVFTQMFNGCRSLQTVPLFNTALGTAFNSMFTNCSSLQTVPLFNTALGTNFASMFTSCSSLQSVPLFNTALGTNFSSMFTNCVSLRTVPLFNTALGTNVSSMFNNCVSLRTVPLFNTVQVSGSGFASMFSACTSLQTVPLFNTALGTYFGSMFTNCSSLQTVPLFNTASATDLNQMFPNCNSLQTVPLFNVASATNFGSMFINCTSLKSAALDARTNLNGRSISYLNCALSAAELNRIFTYLGPGIVNISTITITGNWGANTCDRSIAAAKNWIVAE